MLTQEQLPELFHEWVKSTEWHVILHYCVHKCYDDIVLNYTEPLIEVRFSDLIVISNGD